MRAIKQHEAFARIEEIYRAAGVADRCRLVVGDGGHRFYAAQSWPVFRQVWESYRR